MNKTINAYYESALSLKLPIIYIDEVKGLNVHLGNKNYFLLRDITQMNNASSIFISNNKYFIRSLFQDENIPVPKGISLSRADFLKTSLTGLVQGMQFPLVAKPMLGSHKGEDVLCNIKEIEGLSNYLKFMFKKHKFMLIEEYHTGLKEYQVLLLNGRILSVVERRKPTVIGDGVNSMAQLIMLQYNMSKNHYSKLLGDNCEDYINCLKEQDITPDKILKKNQIAKIRNAITPTLMGYTHALGRRINKKNAFLIRKTAKITGLDLVSLEILCEDINKPFTKSNWFILGVNSPSDITIHESPKSGKAVNVSKKILKQIIYRHPVAYLLHRLKLIYFNLTRDSDNGPKY
ncbi:hypothetical protein [Legionella fallonii]|uniref:Putative cyanophycin synthase n=1 Tax=Legionella fallonii LLAP-10 TaxID=1212491 RepID=A0A098G2D4_9GAMM|nr:hypothetical protein [Legionella fallonii]CEG56642.1 putative cyanophycin synthase [Legionella fallonii LLAP-10]